MGRKILLVDASPWDPVAGALKMVGIGGGQVLRLSNRDFAAGLDGPIVVTQRSLAAGSVLAGSSEASIGQITARWGDGDLDYLTDLMWDGRKVEVLRGDESIEDLGLFDVVFSGRCKRITWNQDALKLKIADQGSRFDRPVQESLYAGTGGMEGRPELAGKRKPVSVGKPRAVEGVPLGNDVYHVHDAASFGSIQDIDEVFDGGVPYGAANRLPDVADIFAAAPPAAGKWFVSPTEGAYRVGGSTARVTAHVQGVVDATLGHVTRLADAVRWLVEMAGPLTTAEVNLASLAALDSALPYDVSFYIAPGDKTIAQQLDDLLVPLLAFRTFDRTGRFGTGVVDPDATPVAKVDEELHQFVAVREVGAPIPSWRRTLGYEKAWTTQRPDELLGGADANYAELVRQEYRTKVDDDVSVRTDHPNAPDTRADSLLDKAADATTEVARQFALLKRQAKLMEAEISDEDLLLSLFVGDAVTFKYPRWGFSAGKGMALVGVKDRVDQPKTTLRMWG